MASIFKGIYLWLIVMAAHSCASLLHSASSIGSSDQIVQAEPGLPLYWGWFPKTEISFEFLELSKRLLVQTFNEVPEFLEDAESFTGQKGAENILQNYTREDPSKGLHCTAMYNGLWPDYVPGAVDYASRPEVIAAVSRPFMTSSIGWIFTPRSFGARLKLSTTQLILWNANDNEGNNRTASPRPEKILYSLRSLQLVDELHKLKPIPQDPDILGNFRPTKGRGSRAHFTLGNSPGVSAVTTGWDLVDIIRLEQAAVSENLTVPTYKISAGWLRNYGSGQWVIYPDYQYSLSSIFRGGMS